jgi:hypothetical protein
MYLFEKMIRLCDGADGKKDIVRDNGARTFRAASPIASWAFSAYSAINLIFYETLDSVFGHMLFDKIM